MYCFHEFSCKTSKKEGASVNDISAGIALSVIKNALFKVIQVKDVSELGDNIVVQGGTFYNDAVLRSMELLLNKNVIRPDISGLMGAYGIALLAIERQQEKSSILTKEELKDFHMETKTYRCHGCGNNCLITTQIFPDGNRYSTGNRCEKGIGTEFFPAQDNARIAVQLELPIGTRKEIAQELSQKLTNQWLTKYKDIMKVCNYTVGQADSDNTWASMQDNGSHIISFNISLVDPGDRNISLETVCDEMREDLKAYPEFSKAQVILGGSNTGMSAQASADFEVYGYDMTMTDSVAANLKRELLKVKGVTEVNISRSDYQPEYQVDFDREKLAMHGLNLSTAGNYLRNRVNGAVASKYREDGDEYDIKVRYAPEFRTSLESLENILIYNAQGQSVRVKDVGKVVERFAPPTIERKDRERIVTVSAVISGAPLGNVVAAGNKVIDKMDLPGDVTIQISGSYEDQQDSFRDLGTLAILIVVLVFIVMAAQFESLTYPFIIMFSLPFAFSGVLMALFFTNSTLSVMSLLGGIMLIGIVVKNGIVLIDYITLCRERGLAVLNSVVTAGKSRLRPVLMTTATTVLGMIPMAIGGGQGSEMWSPMAIAVIGGLTISTILTLILIPTLYCVFAGTGIKNRRRKLRRQRELDVYFQENKESIIKK